MGKYFAKVDGKGYRTILAYPRTGWERVNYYSGPDVKHKKTGKMTGTAVEDNSRVIRENRYMVEILVAMAYNFVSAVKFNRSFEACHIKQFNRVLFGQNNNEINNTALQPAR